MKSLLRILKSIVDIFPWHVISVLIALFFGITTIYLALREIKPNISFNIIAEANVLDVRKPLKDLTILFQGNNIHKNNLNLRIMTIRIENNGNKNILQGDYDNKVPWGLKIEHGKIIETRLVDNNSKYVMSNLKPTLVSNDFLQFSKIIFEKGKYFILELLVLHKKDNLPNLVPIGKIAGIDKIVLGKSWTEEGKRTFISKLFYGDISVQVTRGIVYFLFSIILVICIFSIQQFAINVIHKLKVELPRKRDIESSPSFNNIQDAMIRKIMTHIYVKRGINELQLLRTRLGDSKKLANHIRYFDSDPSHKEYVYNKIAQDKLQFPIYERDLLIYLYHEGFIRINKDDNVEIDQSFQQALERIIKYLKKGIDY